MELWIDVDEKDMLGIVRWIGGEQEENIRRYFTKINVKDV